MSKTFGFSFSDIKEEENKFGLIPTGNYRAVIDSAEVKQNKDKTGYYINLKIKLKGNEKRDGAVLFDIINFDNPSEIATKIGKERLKRLLSIAGVSEADMPNSGPESLVGKSYMLYVGVDSQEGYDDRNKIISYSEIVAQSDAAAQQEEESKSKPSWI